MAGHQVEGSGGWPASPLGTTVPHEHYKHDSLVVTSQRDEEWFGGGGEQESQELPTLLGREIPYRLVAREKKR
jgi:hypothetical protein